MHKNNYFLSSVWVFLKEIFRVQMFYIIVNVVLDLDDHDKMLKDNTVTWLNNFTVCIWAT